MGFNILSIKKLNGFLLLLALLLSTVKVQSQYGFGTNNPNPNSVIHLMSIDSSRGIIIPLVSQTNRPLPANPLKGMLIFNVTDTVFQFCNGITWISLHADSLGDHDFYKSGTTDISRNINDSIYTMGNLGIGVMNPLYSLDVDSNINTGGHFFQLNNQVLSTNPNDLGISKRNTKIGIGALDSVITDSYQNTAVGYYALHNDSNARFNTAVGANSLENNVSGEFNVAIGADAMNDNISGGASVAIGVGSLAVSTANTRNVAIGHGSQGSSTANDNTSIGAFSMFSSTTGGSNVAVGSFSLQNNTSGGANIAIGRESMRNNNTGSSNIAIGFGSLRDNVSGSTNIGIGGSALAANNNGGSNIAIGAASMANNSSGSANVAIGQNALGVNSSGRDNIALGFYSLPSSTTAIRNLSIGTYAMRYNESGSNNIVLGYNAATRNEANNENTIIGNNAFNTAFIADVPNQASTPSTQVNTATNSIVFSGGHGFTPIGSQKELQITSTGTVPAPFTNGQVFAFSIVNDSTLNGSGADITTQGTGTLTFTPYDTSAISFNNTTVLGYDAQPTKSNQVQLGDTRIVEVRTYGNIVPALDDDADLGTATLRWDSLFLVNAPVVTSDVRLKTNIEESTYGLKEILSLTPITYNWKKDPNTGKKIGFKAQELQLIIPEVVNIGNDKNKTLGVLYSDLIPVNSKAIQELNKKIEEKDKLIEELSKKLTDQEKRIKKLEENFSK